MSEFRHGYGLSHNNAMTNVRLWRVGACGLVSEKLPSGLGAGWSARLVQSKKGASVGSGGVHFFLRGEKGAMGQTDRGLRAATWTTAPRPRWPGVLVDIAHEFARDQELETEQFGAKIGEPHEQFGLFDRTAGPVAHLVGGSRLRRGKRHPGGGRRRRERGRCGEAAAADGRMSRRWRTRNWVGSRNGKDPRLRW